MANFQRVSILRSKNHHDGDLAFIKANEFFSHPFRHSPRKPESESYISLDFGFDPIFFYFLRNNKSSFSGIESFSVLYPLNASLLAYRDISPTYTLAQAVTRPDTDTLHIQATYIIPPSAQQ